jgi:hypothetical protein
MLQFTFIQPAAGIGDTETGPAIAKWCRMNDHPSFFLVYT